MACNKIVHTDGQMFDFGELPNDPDFDVAFKFHMPDDWALFEGLHGNGIYQNRNWTGDVVYHLVIDGEYIAAGHEANVVASRRRHLGDHGTTLEHLRERLK